MLSRHSGASPWILVNRAASLAFGLRIPATTVVRMAAEAMTNEEIPLAYSDLERDDISAAQHFAATVRKTYREKLRPTPAQERPRTWCSGVATSGRAPRLAAPRRARLVAAE
jgi:hypothetical protein